MEKKIVSLHEVELSVVKTVGVIEFLNMEIELEERCLNSHKEQVEAAKRIGDERLKAAHKACIIDVRGTIKRLRSRREVQEEFLLKMWQLEYKDGNLYRYDDNDHEQWLMEQVDPSLNGGVL